MLALFDLDGFKQYNDTFGHLAGDALLARLSDRLATALEGVGTAYRMGGDEFCVVAPLGATDATSEIASLAAQALSEAGDRVLDRLLLRDHAPAGRGRHGGRGAASRRSAHVCEQDRRNSASRQSTDVLLQVLSERSTDLHEHLNDVARLARLTARAARAARAEVTRIELAAELHDVGKAAIPDTILDKPSKLDEEEWEFMRGHTLTGERIIRAAPSLAHTADLVRSSHERFDGAGYPGRPRRRARSRSARASSRPATPSTRWSPTARTGGRVDR